MYRIRPGLRFAVLCVAVLCATAFFSSALTGTAAASVHRGTAPYIPAESFTSLVLQSQTPVVVQFGADWCGFCRRFLPTLQGLADRTDGSVAVYRINVDEAADLTDAYRVSSLPTTVLFKYGAEVKRLIGTADEDALVAWVQ
jgi:thioredoxin 1